MAHWSRSALAVLSGVVAFAACYALGAAALFWLCRVLGDKHPDGRLGLYLAVFVWGFFGVVVLAPMMGGFVTARIAKRLQVLHAAAATGIVVLIFASMRQLPGRADLWFIWAYWIIGLIAVAAGTKLGSRAR